jgi:hypothetical protein
VTTGLLPFASVQKIGEAMKIARQALPVVNMQLDEGRGGWARRRPPTARYDRQLGRHLADEEVLTDLREWNAGAAAEAR